MKTLIALSALALAAGCATPGEQVAAVDCKVYPVTIASAAGVRKPNVSSLDQRRAEMQLASSDYRLRNLERNPAMNNVEDALRGCNTR